MHPEPGSAVVDVIIPVLHRPQNVLRLVKSLQATTGDRACPWFIVEEGDTEEERAVLDAGGTPIDCSGTFAHKTNFAWKNLSHSSTDWFMPVGDDVVFRDGWLDAALSAADREKWSVVGTNDLLNPEVQRRELAIHPLISNTYIREYGASWDGPGTVCNEKYFHTYVDNEWTEVARQRGVFGVALDSVVEHMHPFIGKAKFDSIYDKSYSHIEDDYRTFMERKQKYAR